MNAVEQRLTALQQANAVRFARADVKRQVKTGELSVVEALYLGCCQTMRIEDLLKAQRGWGCSGQRKSKGLKAKRLLASTQISPYRPVEELTDRQRGLLVEGLEGA